MHWLTVWQFDPSVWVGCALALVGYRWLPGAHRGRQLHLWVAGVLVLFVALESAIDVVGDNYLFTLHMAQHLMLSMVAPPLIVLGLPPQTIDALLQGRARRLLRLLISPLFAGPAYVAVLVGWHWPPLFDFALTHPLAHVMQHLSFIAVGLLFWWGTLVHRPGERWALSGLGEVVYLTVGALPAVVVGLTVALLPHPVYLYYLHRAPALGMSALADQRVGGILMFVFDSVVMLGAAGGKLWRTLPADGAERVRLRAHL